MTREEQLDWLYRLKSEIYVYMPKEWIIPMNNALDMTIKALEQEPCEDCISRQAVLEIQAKYAEDIGATKFWQMRDDIKALPSVTPQPKTDTLDKIRAEIAECAIPDFEYHGCGGEQKIIELEDVLKIIDKYKAESEKKEEISKDDAIKIVHDTIHDFFVDSEIFTDKDKLLLKINKTICNNIMGY